MRTRLQCDRSDFRVVQKQRVKSKNQCLSDHCFLRFALLHATILLLVKSSIFSSRHGVGNFFNGINNEAKKIELISKILVKFFRMVMMTSALECMYLYFYFL